MSKRKINKVEETRLEYEMRQRLLFPKEIIPKLDECMSILNSATKHDEFLHDYNDYEYFKDKKYLSDDSFINIIGQMIKYNIRQTQFNLGFLDHYINIVCDELHVSSLSNEQKDKLKDIKETYSKHFIFKISDFNVLYERQKIVDKLEKISHYEKQD